ncbi:MAG TPA: hypothetical protein VGD69_10135 [Herpetosiphonaceae bacterium]
MCQRVVEAVARGMLRADVVRTFQVSLATRKRYLKQRRETGQVMPKPYPGRPASKGAALAAQLDHLLEAEPDATLDALCQQWVAISGVVVSTATMSRVIRQHEWTRKKRRWVPVSATRSSGLPSGSGSQAAPPPTS